MADLNILLHRCVQSVLSPRRRAALGLILRHRRRGYALLEGNGIEIGALHIPAQLPRSCKTTYADAISADEAAKLFPELNPSQLVPVSLLVDLDRSGLAGIADRHFDYAILNHVIEHVANPIHAVAELFRVVRPGGHVVISAPDKHYTYDKPRPLTSFAHLLAEYKQGVTAVSEEHYRELALALQKSDGTADENSLRAMIEDLRRRREHAHVWDCANFADFMRQSLDLLGIRAEAVYVSEAEINRGEYFSVWKKLPPGVCD